MTVVPAAPAVKPVTPLTVKVTTLPAVSETLLIVQVAGVAIEFLADHVSVVDAPLVQ